MTHDEAIKSGATERYVLDEMTDEERDGFEQHYFDCAVCAEDVNAAIAIRDGLAAERVPVQPAVVPFEPKRRWMPASLAAAASLMIGALFMQVGYVAPLLRPTTPALHVLSETRAETNQILDRTKPNELLVNIDPSDQAAQFTWAILDARNRERASQVVPANQITSDLLLPVNIAPKSLAPGKYTLRLVGRGITTYSFTVR
jgi:hypothetical protein